MTPPPSILEAEGPNPDPWAKKYHISFGSVSRLTGINIPYSVICIKKKSFIYIAFKEILYWNPFFSQIPKVSIKKKK